MMEANFNLLIILNYKKLIFIYFYYIIWTVDMQKEDKSNFKNCTEEQKNTFMRYPITLG